MKLFVNILTAISILLPILYFVGFSRNGKTYKIFNIYLLFIAVIQIVAAYFASKNINNTFLFHYYFIGQFIFLSIFYSFLFKKKSIHVITLAVLIVLSIYYLKDPTIINEYHTFGVSVTQSILIVYALLYYYRSLSGNSKMLFINTGILLYLMVSLLFFASNNLIISLGIPKDTQKYIGLFNELSYLLFMILIFTEWYRNYRPKKGNRNNL